MWPIMATKSQLQPGNEKRKVKMRKNENAMKNTKYQLKNIAKKWSERFTDESIRSGEI